MIKLPQNQDFGERRNDCENYSDGRRFSSIRQMVKFVVSGAGYNLSEAENGREGLARAGEKQVDMVITDLNMPVMNGM